MNSLRGKQILYRNLLISILALFLSSCDPAFFEYEGDCKVHYIIRFDYTMNLKWADAFPSEVKSVNLYVFDEDGVFLREYNESGDILSSPDFGIEVDLEAGKYSFLAWCGLDDKDSDDNSFSIISPETGKTTLNEMICSLITTHKSIYNDEVESTLEYSNSPLKFLYWGYIEETLVDNYDGSTYEYLIPLIKDTNHVRIILQELNGENLNPGDYEICIKDANGKMNWDNELIGEEIITYQPWSQENALVGVGKIDVMEGDLNYVKGLVADLDVARLMANQQNDVMLVISNSETKEVIANIPFIQYALLSKAYYEKAYNHVMTDQEFLDREDDYVMTFFLVNGKWMDAYINIQQWHIVLHDYDVEG